MWRACVRVSARSSSSSACGTTIDGSALGWSWEVTYDAATKEEAEAAMHKQGTTYWWVLDGYSRTATAVVRLSLAGTMFATVVTRRLSSLTLRHGWFGCAVRGLLHGGETCRVRVAERRRVPGHFRATLPCACNVTRAVTPHFRQSVFTPRRGSVSVAQK